MSGTEITRRNVLAVIAGGPAVAAASRVRAEARSAETRRCYVDGVAGSDARDGLTPTTALKTLAAALKTTPAPVWIGLARNSRFHEALPVRTSITIEAYGYGAMPVIDSAMPLAGDSWVKVAQGTWAFTSKIAQAEALIVGDRRVSRRPSLGPGDSDGSWAWTQATIHLRSEKHPRDEFGTILAVNRPCVSVIDASNVALHQIAAVNGVHGFVGQRSRGVEITDCSATDCTNNGFYLANDTSEWTLVGCVAERNGGAGFALNYGAAKNTILRSRGNRNGIDGCQFSEGCGTGNALIGCEFRENAVAGVNCKEKRQRIEHCRMIDNGEAGVIAQINTELLEISDSVIAGNNRADNGTMNLALEDRARVASSRNVYIDPYGRKKEAVNVRLIGQSALHSVADCFVDRLRAGNVAASIRVATRGGGELSVVHGSIYNTASRIGRIVDARGTANLSLTITNTAVAGATVCLAYESATKVATSHNCYHNAAGGPIIEVSGGAPRQVVRENLIGFAREHGVEFASIAANPRFVDPDDLDLSLAADSPARSAGSVIEGVRDNFNIPFALPPNIGAVSAPRDLRGKAAL